MGVAAASKKDTDAGGKGKGRFVSDEGLGSGFGGLTRCNGRSEGRDRDSNASAYVRRDGRNIRADKARRKGKAAQPQCRLRVQNGLTTAKITTRIRITVGISLKIL